MKNKKQLGWLDLIGYHDKMMDDIKKLGCRACSKPIHWWQKSLAGHDPLPFFIHACCKDKMTEILRSRRQDRAEPPTLWPPHDLPKKFIPSSPGCSFSCPIEQEQHSENQEICCDSARQCCFFCFDDCCPVKEFYADIIKKYA